MRPDEMLARRLAGEVHDELRNLSTLRAESAGAPRGDDSYSLRARASILHDFYTCVERVFVLIAEELNGGVPAGEHWHRRLLHTMSLEIAGVRPAVVSEELARALGEYLRFRHVFRSVYGFVLDESRMKPLEDAFPATATRASDELVAFTEWLVGED
jgi:hypothetical protein